MPMRVSCMEICSKCGLVGEIKLNALICSRLKLQNSFCRSHNQADQISILTHREMKILFTISFPNKKNGTNEYT